jgi:MazG family protein
MAQGTRPTRAARSKTSVRARRKQPTASAGREFQKLVDIMRRLRGSKGCPWDREQTFASLRPFVLEETYEVLQAIDANDPDALKGEVGDLLFEGVFLAQIAADEGRFDIADSLRAISAKLIRRHPHVFGTTAGINTAGKVLEQWEQIKSREQTAAGEQRSVLRGLPKALPSLLHAHEIGTRVAAVGFDWPKTVDVIDKIEEEVAELRRAIQDGEGRLRAEEEMGDLLFSIANLARKLSIEPESALRMANAKFTERFTALERHLEARGQSVHDATLEEMEEVWQTVKHSMPHARRQTESWPRKKPRRPRPPGRTRRST